MKNYTPLITTPYEKLGKNSKYPSDPPWGWYTLRNYKKINSVPEPISAEYKAIKSRQL